ncbi:MAG TPA: enoyl-CoA hydratase/isomerase family protein [Candidatus Dormibacteraeota bacterium]|nr:enoyl-CoA hydratase/isomerase family protein [Candidatus Dormibacteraeota bacterium]
MSLKRERAGGVEWWTLDRPDQMNALSSDLVAGIAAAARDARTDPSLRVVVITGSGRGFSAGADLKEARVALERPSAFAAMLGTWRATFRELELLPLPVIAALNGITLAGGLELALACDLVIASSAARIGDGHIRYGLVPGGGGSQRLADAIGARAARWLMYSGELLDAEAAFALGLVQKVVPAATFLEDVQSVAEAMAARSSSALAFMKRMSRARGVSDIDLQAELEGAVAVVTGLDARAGLAAFAAGEEPVFSKERLE